MMDFFKSVIINAKDRDEIRVGFVENDVLMELYYESESLRSKVGNLYFARVDNIVEGMDAAFLDIGTGKKAFLRSEDLCKIYRKNKEPVITSLKAGQKLIVQVKKDSFFNKGPQVTTYVSVTGRYLVYLPYSRKVSISRKIREKNERNRLLKLVKEIRNGKGGFIIRTLAKAMDETIIEREARELVHSWEEILNKTSEKKAPVLLYKEPDLVDILLRDKVNDVNEIVVDDFELQRYVKQKTQNLNIPIIFYGGDDLFSHYGIESQILDSLDKKVNLRCGGSIYIQKTEALTVIDVNAGKNVKNGREEDVILATNKEAAKEIARQLRLRNLSGIIIVDFIDMNEDKEREQVKKVLETEMMKDKTRSFVMGFTQLGLLEMTRKRTLRTVYSSLQQECPVCKGAGFIFRPEIVVDKVKNDLKKMHLKKKISSVELKMSENAGKLFEKEKEKLEKELNIDIKLTFSDAYLGKYEILIVK